MHDESIKLEIVTPKGVVLAVDVSEFTAPSVEGEFGILPGHRPLLAALRIGLVSYVAEGETNRAAVGAGFVEYANGHAVLLTDSFMAQGDVDPVLVRLALKHADEALDHFAGESGSAEHLALVERELWAVTQLELYGDPPPPAVTGFRFTGSTPEKYEHLGDAEDATGGADALSDAAPGAGGSDHR